MENGAVLVVGGSGGLGQGICRRLADDWGAMVLTYRSGESQARDVARDLPDRVRVEIAAMDIRDDDDVAAALAAADALPGGLRAVVFAAGADILQPYVSQMDQATWDRVIGVELLGFTRLVRLAIPILRRNGGGAFVSIVSVATFWFPPGDAISAVPKAGIEMLTRAVAKEEGRHGIRANAVAPGIIDAGLGKALQDKTHSPEVWARQRRSVPLRRFGEAADVAEAVAFLASGRAAYVTGQTLVVDGGLSL